MERVFSKDTHWCSTNRRKTIRNVLLFQPRIMLTVHLKSSRWHFHKRYSNKFQMLRFPMNICFFLTLIMLHLAPLATVKCKSPTNATSNGPDNTGCLVLHQCLCWQGSFNIWHQFGLDWDQIQDFVLFSPSVATPSHTIHTHVRKWGEGVSACRTPLFKVYKIQYWFQFLRTFW